MSDLSSPISYDEQALLRHIPNEERAKSIASRLDHAASSLSRYAESDNIRQYRQIAEQAESLYRYCAKAVEAMDDILLTMRHASNEIQNMLEESSAATAHKLSMLDVPVIHTDL